MAVAVAMTTTPVAVAEVILVREEEEEPVRTPETFHAPVLRPVLAVRHLHILTVRVKYLWAVEAVPVTATITKEEEEPMVAALLLLCVIILPVTTKKLTLTEIPWTRWLHLTAVMRKAMAPVGAEAEEQFFCMPITTQVM